MFDSLKGVIKVPSVVIDNNVFQLHYRFTVLVLAAFSILVTGRQYFGDPIDCINNDDIPEQVLETFCWVHATFSLPAAWNKTVGEDIPYPGVEKFKKGEDRVYHKYYQWVCFVLFLQAVLFYLPRYMWKMWEGGRLKNLVLGLNTPIMTEEFKNKNKALLVSYLRGHLGNHKLYVSYYILCEMFNFANVVGQMYLIDTFLGGEFTSFGTKVLAYSETDQEYRNDPMVRVFPRMAKCTFHRYGPSGDVQRHDAFCLLPLNIINEKIYIFLWFWFIILAVLSGIILIYRLVVVVSAKVRYNMLKSRARLVDRNAFDTVMERTELGDWFIIYLLSKNLDSVHFREVISDLSRELTGETPLLSAREEKEREAANV